MGRGCRGPGSGGLGNENDGSSRGGGIVAQYSGVTAKSIVPLLSSGLCWWSKRNELASILQKYSERTMVCHEHSIQTRRRSGYLPGVSCSQRLHFQCDPPFTHLHQALMYPLHSAHRGGPLSPKSTNGTSSSRGSRSAKGWIITAMGISHSLASRDVLGMFQVVIRICFGDELP